MINLHKEPIDRLAHPIWIPMLNEHEFADQPLRLPPYPKEADVRMALACWAHERGMFNAVCYSEDGSVMVRISIEPYQHDEDDWQWITA